MNCLKSAGKAGEKRACEVELRPKLGAPRFLHVECIAQLDQWERPQRYHLAILEITERKKTDASATKKIEQYRELLETIGAWFWEVDQDGRYLQVSIKVKYSLGYDPEEIVGKTLFDLMPPAEADRVSTPVSHGLEQPRALTSFENHLSPQGRWTAGFLETNGTPVIDGQGKCVGFRGMFGGRSPRLETSF